MAKLPSLDHVKYVRAKGRIYAYFNTGRKKDGKPIYAALPKPGSVGFLDSYTTMLGARTKREAVGYTVADMAREFEQSPAFAGNAQNTQILYSKTLRRIVQFLGKFPVNALERQHVKTVLDNEMAGPGAHNIFIAVLSSLYAWARDRGKASVEPTRDIGRLKIEQHQPWPDHVVEAALATDDRQIRLLVSLLYFTGQRVGDVLKMRWSDISDGVIHVVQQKTGKEVWVPLISDLEQELAETPKRAMTIVSAEDGTQLRTDQVLRQLKRFTIAMGHKTVTHGLRKNAVNALLEAGCSVAETAAITGQTYKLVEHYAKKINQKRMAKAAIYKLENKRRTGKRSGKPDA